MTVKTELTGSARLVLADGVAYLDPESAVFEAMLEGWGAEQRTRFLKEETVRGRLDLMRRFAAFTGLYPCVNGHEVLVLAWIP